MRKLVVCLLFLTSLAHADILGGSGPAGPNITGCKKMSSWYFCQKYFGNFIQAINVATICQAQNGGDSSRIHLSYTNDPAFPPRPYYAIYWAKCLEYETGGIAPPGGVITETVVAELTALFDGTVAVSEFLDDADGNVTIYISDSLNDTFYSSTWSLEGALLHMEAIDPETDEGLIQAARENGLAFYLLHP